MTVRDAPGHGPPSTQDLVNVKHGPSPIKEFPRIIQEIQRCAARSSRESSLYGASGDTAENTPACRTSRTARYGWHSAEPVRAGSASSRRYRGIPVIAGLTASIGL